jgi:uncharacterized protein (TIGR03437 family)
MHLGKTIGVSVLLWNVGFLAAQTPASLISSYQFQGNLNPERLGSLPLTAVDPQNANRFVRDTVFGQERQVYEWGGGSASAQQGGLIYSGRELFNRNSYSLELIFTFTAGSGYRRVLDISNRTSDDGFYIDQNNRLNWYPAFATTVGATANGQYSHVVLTVNNNLMIVYVNGQEVARSTANFTGGNISPTVNPNQLIHLFLDNTASGSTNEWAPGRIALFRVYNSVVTPAQVTTLFNSPFTATIGIDQPYFSSTRVVNGASNSNDAPISPNSFFTIFGSNLSDVVGPWDAAFANNFAPRTLNNVRVLVQNQEAFISFTRTDQINALAPDNIPEGPVTVVVEKNGVQSPPVTVQARRLNPSLFMFAPQNARYVASTANDGSAYIAPANLFGTNGVLNNLRVRPARPGEFIVLYANGLGPTVPALPAGQIPPPRDGAYPLLTPSEVRLTPEAGGSTVTVIPAYAGMSGFPGLYQVVFQTPNLPNGDYRVVLSVGGQTSPAGTFLAIEQ